MEETGGEIICGAQTTIAVNGQVMDDDDECKTNVHTSSHPENCIVFVALTVTSGNRFSSETKNVQIGPLVVIDAINVMAKQICQSVPGRPHRRYTRALLSTLNFFATRRVCTRGG